MICNFKIRPQWYQTIWPVNLFNQRHIDIYSRIGIEIPNAWTFLPSVFAGTFRESNTYTRCSHRAGQLDFRYAFAIIYTRYMYTVLFYILRYGIYKRVPKSLRFPSLRVSLTLRPPERYRSFLAFLSSRSAYVSPISPEESRWNTGERPCISSRKLAASARRIMAKDSDLRIHTNCWNQIIDNLRNYRYSRNSRKKI